MKKKSKLLVFFVGLLVAAACTTVTTSVGSSEVKLKVNERNRHARTGWVYTNLYTDDLGCTWFLASGTGGDTGVAPVHHPTCKNPNHK